MPDHCALITREALYSHCYHRDSIEVIGTLIADDALDSEYSSHPEALA